MNPTASRHQTLEMTVANTGFMLDRLGQDCSPLQFLRELTRNSIEAIQSLPVPEGKILWDIDWDTFDLTNGESIKLCILDNGVGMTAENQVEFINKLSSSIHQQAYDGNFGVGAKIAAATRNHEGLVYLSWKDEVGSMIHLWRDPDTGQYGLKQFETPNGNFEHVGLIDDALKPDWFGAHGTKVVLLGNTADQVTMNPPPGARTPTKWIRRYLNTRFYRLPDGIELRVREGWEHPRSDGARNVTRRVIGQAEYLTSHSQASGRVELADATAHWWILRDEPALTGNSGESASAGHMAALHKDELYDLKEANAGYARLQLFGIYFAYNRVVIYVEPRGPSIISNTARTDLLVSNEPLPWTDWAAEFRDKMPDEIRSLMEDVAGGAKARDHKAAILERLRRIKDLLRISRYRRTPAGGEGLDPNSPAVGGRSGDGSRERSGSGTTSGTRGGAGGSIYSLFLKPDGEPGEEIASDQTPNVTWISVGEGTRAQGFLEDRAGKYFPETNQLHINSDFRGFQDMIAYWRREYSSIPGSELVIEEVVKEWFEQSLIEAILGVLSLRGSQEWNLNDLSAAWSEEALSAVVLVRYHVSESVKRVLGQRLHSLKERRDSAVVGGA